MNRSDIIRMAREAGAEVFSHASVFSANDIERFFHAAYAAGAAAEREAIIQAMPGGHSVDPQWVCDMIRTRSNT